MANVPLKNIRFPGLDDTYTVPQIDVSISQAGKAADAKAVGDALATKLTAGDIDNTLAVSGKAADAKAAGDAINALKTKSDAYTSPNTDVLKNILVPDFADQTVQNRTYHKTGNQIFIKASNVNNNGCIISLTGDMQRGVQATLSNYTPNVGNLVDIEYYKPMLISVLNKPTVSSMTNYIGVRFYKNGQYTEGGGNVSLDNTVNKLSILNPAAPADATHFEIILYTRKSDGLPTTDYTVITLDCFVDNYVQTSDLMDLTEKSFIWRNRLTSSDDLDNINLPGVYVWPSTGIPAHTPLSEGIGRLLVYELRHPTSDSASFNPYWIQMAYQNGIWYTRTWSGTSGWSDWTGLATVNMTNKADLPYYIKNMQKKLDQMRTISWTAKGDVYNKSYTPSATDKNKYLVREGATATGIPYSSVKEYDKFVPQNVSFRTFMTAVNNPYSLLYTEMIRGEYSDSAYNLTYHGSNCGCYFGAVCSSLVGYSLGMLETYGSGNYVGYLVKAGIMEKITDQSAAGAQIGDVLHTDGHVLIVNNISYTTTGAINKITTTQTGGTFPASQQWTESGFNNLLNGTASGYEGKKHTIVRYKHIYKNTEYIPSEFVAIDDELIPTEYSYNEDICTFAGDYAAFRTGETIWINYNLGTTVYDQLKIYDATGTQVGSTIALSSGSDHKISIGNSLPAGLYTATLVLNDVESEPTHFEVIDTTVNLTINNGTANVTFSSSNATPLYYKMCDLPGNNLGICEFTESERAYGKISFSPTELHMAEYNKTLTGDAYLKVFFKGQYGTVTNVPIQINYSA